MSKSAIYVVNTTNQTLISGQVINIGSVIRRFGQNINLNGENIAIQGGGYYDVDAEFIFTGTATSATATTITLLKDNVAVPGAFCEFTLAAGDVVTAGINALIREFGCCCDNYSNLSFIVSGGAVTMNNISIVVEKV